MGKRGVEKGEEVSVLMADQSRKIHREKISLSVQKCEFIMDVQSRDIYRISSKTYAKSATQELKSVK